MNKKEMEESLIEKTARLIQDSRLAVIFTGAGISTPSGIPDFRSARTGLWENDNPMEVASVTSFNNTPEKFFHWLKPLAEKIAQAKPNPAHQAIARLEEAGFIKAVITQNIDHLHQDAGSKHVLELHGSMQTCTCLVCRKKYQSSQFITRLIQNNEIPLCLSCNGILKPDIILFEELLPVETWDEANTLSLNCDLILVAGSSLEVVPAATIPLMAVRTGARMVILNRTTTHLDPQASIIIHEDLVDVLPEIAERLL